MNALSILAACRNSAAEISRIEGRIQRRRDAATGLTVHMDPNGGSHGGGHGDRMADFAADIIDLEDQLKARQRKRAAEVRAANKLLDGLTELDAGVLYAYYIEGTSVAAYARAKGYSDGYMRNVKRKAEDQMRMIPETEVRAALPKWYLAELSM